MSFLALMAQASIARAGLLQDHYDQAKAFAEKGQFQQAVNYYEKAVDLDPNFAPAYNGLGLAHFELGAPLSDVIWFFKVAVEIDPEFTEAYANMCRVYYQNGKYDDAEAAGLKALELNPNVTAVQLTLAWTYLLGKSKPSEALHYFELAKEKVDSPMVVFGMGMAYIQQGDNARVLESITILRSKGANDFASQLEGSIRKAQAPPAPVKPNLTSTASPASQLITNQSKTVSAPPPPDSTTSSPVSGQMQIRLRGRLENLEEPEAEPVPGEPTPVPEDPKRHPGSLSPS